LRYRRAPVDPASSGNDLDLPGSVGNVNDQYCEWACMYAAHKASASKKDFNTANYFASMLNTEAKQVGIRNMIPRLSVADTNEEAKIAEVTT
jgi:hypothetical protein